MFTLNKTNISLLANINRKGECWVGAYIEKTAADDYYPKLVEHKDDINLILGESFDWIENDKYLYRSIRISKNFGDLNIDSNKAASQNWVAEEIIKYLPLFKDIVSKYL